MLLRGILITLSLASHGLINADSLYSDNEHILELNTDTFDNAVYNSEKAHFVEFYSSWCGACISYAPTFKSFAADLSPWKPFVQVTTVNCADDENLPLCRKHAVAAFPTIKFFKHRAQSKDDGIIFTGNKYDTLGMELDVAAFVQKDYESQNHRLASIFQPIESSATLQDIWRSAGSASYLGIVVEDDPAKTAWALILNFHGDRHTHIVLARPEHPEVAKIFGGESPGRFVLFKRGEQQAVLTTSNDQKWTDLRDRINEQVSFDKGGNLPPAGKVAAEAAQAPAPVANVDMTQYQVQLVDLKSAISYMLMKEIPRRQVIQGKELVALKHWMRTMSKYAPGTTPIRRLLYRMNEWIRTLGDRLDINDWIKKLNEVQLELGNPLPTKVEWIACIGSKPNLRGYTCGVWTLMHAVTVAAYKAEAKNPSFNPVDEVMEPFHQFIFHFLSCGECAKNFDKEAKKHRLVDVTTREEMVMWFWRVHNFVNARLSGSRSDDPRFPKRQFPPSVLCNYCYDPNGSFDEKKILHFLLNYYDNIRQDTVEAPPEYKMHVYKDGKLQAVGARHLNPKFAVHADKVDKLEETEDRLRKELDARPQREWKDIEGYETLAYTSDSQFYLIWLTVIGIVIVLAYCKYRRNRSKFWKTFYYHSDFKLFPWRTPGSAEKKYSA